MSSFDTLEPWQRPIVILGAARSGTNILRDALCNIPGVGTWPCDEINYIWRFGNRSHPHDEFDAERILPKTRNFIHSAFRKQSRRQNLRFLVEKTCANSLRVHFVRSLFPQAKFLFIIRDGRDVVASARLRWNAKLDWRYTFRKVMYVPKSDLPHYAVSYAKNRLFRMFAGQGRLATWGPRYSHIQEHLSELTLEQVCAHQWSESVRKADADLQQLPAEQFLTIKYEELTADPDTVMTRIASFLEIPTHKISWNSMVHSQSVGQWPKRLTMEMQDSIRPIVEPTLEQWGYSVS